MRRETSGRQSFVIWGFKLGYFFNLRKDYFICADQSYSSEAND